MVIAAGGGGIPVVRRGVLLQGSEAVIDKDRCSALLATELTAEVLLFSTGVTHVYQNFGTKDEKPLFRLSWEEAHDFLEEGEFAAGSMGPKVEAALTFLEAGGQRAIITAPEYMAAALRGAAGTEISPPLRDSRETIAIQPRPVWSME